MLKYSKKAKDAYIDSVSDVICNTNAKSLYLYDGEPISPEALAAYDVETYTPNQNVNIITSKFRIKCTSVAITPIGNNATPGLCDIAIKDVHGTVIPWDLLTHNATSDIFDGACSVGGTFTSALPLTLYVELNAPIIVGIISITPSSTTDNFAGLKEWTFEIWSDILGDYEVARVFNTDAGWVAGKERDFPISITTEYETVQHVLVSKTTADTAAGNGWKKVDGEEIQSGRLNKTIYGGSYINGSPPKDNLGAYIETSSGLIHNDNLTLGVLGHQAWDGNYLSTDQSGHVGILPLTDSDLVSTINYTSNRYDQITGYSEVFIGHFLAKAPGDYTFCMENDAGAAMWLGNTVIDSSEGQLEGQWILENGIYDDTLGGLEYHDNFQAIGINEPAGGVSQSASQVFSATLNMAQDPLCTTSYIRYKATDPGRVYWDFQLGTVYNTDIWFEIKINGARYTLLGGHHGLTQPDRFYSGSFYLPLGTEIIEFSVRNVSCTWGASNSYLHEIYMLPVSGGNHPKKCTTVTLTENQSYPVKIIHSDSGNPSGFSDTNADKMRFWWTPPLLEERQTLDWFGVYLDGTDFYKTKSDTFIRNFGFLKSEVADSIVFSADDDLDIYLDDVKIPVVAGQATVNLNAGQYYTFETYLNYRSEIPLSLLSSTDNFISSVYNEDDLQERKFPIQLYNGNVSNGQVTPPSLTSFSSLVGGLKEDVNFTFGSLSSVRTTSITYPAVTYLEGNLVNIPFTSVENFNSIINHGSRGDSWGELYIGYLYTKKSGNYQFCMESNSGGAMWLGDSAIESPRAGLELINNGLGYTGDNAKTCNSIWLDEGELVPVRIAFLHSTGTDKAKFWWTPPGGDETQDLKWFGYFGDGTQWNDTEYTYFQYSETKVLSQTGATINLSVPSTMDVYFDNTLVSVSNNIATIILGVAVEHTVKLYNNKTAIPLHLDDSYTSSESLYDLVDGKELIFSELAPYTFSSISDDIVNSFAEKYTPKTFMCAGITSIKMERHDRLLKKYNLPKGYYTLAIKINLFGDGNINSRLGTVTTSDGVQDLFVVNTQNTSTTYSWKMERAQYICNETTGTSYDSIGMNLPEYYQIIYHPGGDMLIDLGDTELVDINEIWGVEEFSIYDASTLDAELHDTSITSTLITKIPITCSEIDYEDGFITLRGAWTGYPSTPIPEVKSAVSVQNATHWLLLDRTDVDANPNNIHGDIIMGTVSYDNVTGDVILENHLTPESTIIEVDDAVKVTEFKIRVI